GCAPPGCATSTAPCGTSPTGRSAGSATAPRAGPGRWSTSRGATRPTATAPPGPSSGSPTSCTSTSTGRPGCWSRRRSGGSRSAAPTASGPAWWPRPPPSSGGRWPASSGPASRSPSTRPASRSRPRRSSPPATARGSRRAEPPPAHPVARARPRARERRPGERPSSIVGSVTVQALGATEAGGAMANPDVFTMVLAGGEGKRLAPLTADRAKPAVPFGGDYRLVDFVLSNLVNGGYLRIAVLTQYKSHSLDRHVTTTWRLSPLLGGYVTPVPAQMRRGPRWYAGSADAIFQSLNLVYDERPDYVIVFGADHVYRMDPRQMVAQHIDSGTGVTVAGIRVPIGDADQFGVIETAGDGRAISAFREKPSDPQGLPDAPDQVFASMGNYVFRTDTLIEAVSLDAKD